MPGCVCNYSQSFKVFVVCFLFIPPFKSSLSIRSINANDLDVEQQGSIYTRIFQHEVEGTHPCGFKNKVKDDDDVEVVVPELTASDI